MVVVRLENFDELVTLRLWEAGTLGIAEGDGFADAFFDDIQAASQFGEPKAVEEEDWVARTHEAFPPLLVGDRFFIAPPWRTACWSSAIVSGFHWWNSPSFRQA